MKYVNIGQVLTTTSNTEWGHKDISYRTGDDEDVTM